MGTALPTGPLDTPRRELSGLWRSCEGGRGVMLLGARAVGRWNGCGPPEGGIGRAGESFAFFSNNSVKSVCVTAMASATSTMTPLSSLSSSPSCSSLLSL